MLKFFLFTCLAIVSVLVNGQHFNFRQYQVENGLSNNMVTCSIQDKQGFLWFGTRDGLNRFDGYTFKVFRNDRSDKTSIGNNRIKSLCIDSLEGIWVGTQKGLFYFNPATENFKLLEIDTPGLVNDMKMDSYGNLWFISNTILKRYNSLSRQLTIYDTAKYFKSSSLCFVGKQLWVSTADGLLKRYDVASNSFQSFDVFRGIAATTKNKWIEKIYATSDGALLIGTAADGAKIFNSGTQILKEILTHSEDNTPLFVKQFIQVSENEYWIATESGIFKYDIETGAVNHIIKKHNDPYSLSDNSINTFCMDNDGGIWIGTSYGGLNYLNKHSFFEKYFPKQGENSLSGNVVREIHGDTMGNLWIGTEDAGFNKMDIRSEKFINFRSNGSKNSISYNNVHAMLIDGNNVWIGTYIHGLHVMNIKTGKIIKSYAINKGKNLLQNDFCMTRSLNSEIFIGTIQGVYLYNRNKDDFSLITGLPIDWYACLLKDNKGTLWAGSFTKGVSCYNQATGQKSTFKYDSDNPKGIGSGRINSIYNDSKGRLWFATEGGLCLYNEMAMDFKIYTTENGFPSNFILSILDDDKQNLWITTTRGLVCFNPDSGQVKIFKKENGILNDQFNYNSAYKTKEGKMYFGSVKGLIGFDPKAMPTQSFNAPIYITGFQVNNVDLPIGKPGSPLNTSITWTDEIVLKYTQSSFSIDFAALNYSAPTATEYAYEMEGLEKGWTYLKSNRKVYFTNLSPGYYRFKVKATSGEDKGIGPERILIVRILPPWWLSVQAYLLYGATGILMIILSVRNYHKKVQNRHKREMEQREIAKTKEMYEEKLEFFTNVAHEIKTPLTLIKGPLKSMLNKVDRIPEFADNLKIMDRNTERLVNLTNQFLDFRQTEIMDFGLDFTKENISELLMEIYESFCPLAASGNLRYTIKIPDETVFAWIDKEAFTKIINNLFSNAVKYADSIVHINLLGVQKTDNSFIIEICNDGYVIPNEMAERIFEPFFRLKETQKYQGTGIGLALSLTLAKLHKGMIVLKNDRPGINTFLLTMPIEQ